MGDLVSSIPRSDAHLVDYYENSGEGVAFYAQILKEKDQRGWDYGKHYGPHDLDHSHCQVPTKSRMSPATWGSTSLSCRGSQQDGFRSKPPATS